MNDDIKIPSAASLYILLQRTSYQSKMLGRLLRRVPGPFSLFFAKVEAALRRNRIATRFTRGIRRDYSCIAPFLPDAANAILDIGCGLAAIDILLSRHYSPNGPVHLYLADFEETSSHIEYGFGPQHAHYNSLAIANELLLRNEVPASTIHFVAPHEIEKIEPLPRFQLVISTLAWGFHFPVEAYVQVVSNALDKNGRLILDLRVGTDGIQQLHKYFPVVDVIEESETRQRVIARK